MGSRIYDFSYDANGIPVSIAYRTRATATPTYYFYGVNSRGDVIALYNSGGTLVACYNYDAYGKLISVENANGVAITSATHVANMNPLRYRGYVYDTESGLYYLQSRYYDPTTCRFINGDSQLNIDSFNGFNQFAYCNNNPIVFSDPNGLCSQAWKAGYQGPCPGLGKPGCMDNNIKNTTSSSPLIGGATMVSNDLDYFSFDTLFWGEENGINSTKLTSGDFNQPITFFAQEANDWWRISDYHVGVNAIINDYSSSLSISLFGIHCRGAYEGGESYEVQVGIDKIGYTVSYDYDFNSNTMGAYTHKYIRPWSIVTVFVLAGVTYGAASGLFATQQLQSCY